MTESRRKPRGKVKDKERDRNRKKKWMINKESQRRMLEGSKKESRRHIQTKKETEAGAPHRSIPLRFTLRSCQGETEKHGSTAHIW